jgi:hypothetical protein
MKDVEETFKHIPKEHAALMKGYKFIFQADNTLKNDKDHIGVIDDKEKTVTLAAPYNYSREFTTLHELAHLVFRTFLTKELVKQWNDIIKKDKHGVKDTSEEIFCHCYANNYVANPVEKYDVPEWNKFIKKVPTIKTNNT